LSSALPTTFEQGVTIERAGTAQGWPSDGAAMTIRQADGTYAMQFNWSYNDGIGYVGLRVGQDSTWYPWIKLGAPPQTVALTMAASWVAFDGSYTLRAIKDVAGNVRLQGLIKNGTTTTGTVICTLPVGYRPSQNCWFGVTCATDGQVARLYVNALGQVVLHHTPTATFIALDGINFAAS
jgi:hypothetical protein